MSGEQFVPLTFEVGDSVLRAVVLSELALTPCSTERRETISSFRGDPRAQAEGGVLLLERMVA